MNPAAEDLFQTKSEHLIHESLEKLWIPKHADAYQTLLNVPPQKTEEYHDLDIFTYNKQQKPVDIRACRIEYGGQDAIYFLFRDITENRRAREEILAANARLRDLDQLKTDFINTVSHELRTPLTSMRWSTESLSQLINQDDETVAKLLRIIRDDNHRLANMIEELLGFARLDAGKLKLNLTDLDLVPLLNDACEKVGALAHSKKIQLTQTLECSTLNIHADTEQIRSVIMNVLDNAIKYTPPNGQISVTLTATNQNATIAIKDTGIGISQDDQAHIFEKFYRTNQADVQNERGTGLGLAIVRGIVEAHGGIIEVESKLHEGATFQITLPARA